jgi:hypothetical protein
MGIKLDAEGFEVPDATNVYTNSNPKLRPVEAIQKSEMKDYEAAGQIPSPYIKNGVTQGWLVSSCVVVAPRHAIIGAGNVGRDLSKIEVDFMVGYQGKNNFKQQVKIKPISCGIGNNSDKMPGEDFCIYKANRPLKGLVKPIKVASIDYKKYSIEPEIQVGFFPQASKQLDVLAKDVNAKIVDGDSTYLQTRAANVSGAGLIQEKPETHEKYLIGMQVNYFNAVNAQRVIEERAAILEKNPDTFKCN